MRNPKIRPHPAISPQSPNLIPNSHLEALERRLALDEKQRAYRSDSASTSRQPLRPPA